MSGRGEDADSRINSQTMANTFNTNNVKSIVSGSNASINNNITTSNNNNTMDGASTSYATGLTPALNYDKSHQSPLCHTYSVESLPVPPYMPTGVPLLTQPLRQGTSTTTANSTIPSNSMINIPYQYDLNKPSQSLSKDSSSSSLPVIQPSSYLNTAIPSSYSQTHRLPSMNQQMPQNVQQASVLQHQNVLVDNQSFIDSSKYKNNSNGQNDNFNNDINTNMGGPPNPNQKIQQTAFNQYPQEPEYYATNVKTFQPRQQQQQQHALQKQTRGQLQMQHPTSLQAPLTIRQHSYPLQMDATLQGHPMEYCHASSANFNRGQDTNQISKPFSMIDAGNNRRVKLDYTKIDRLAYEISQNMIVPPFKNLKPSKASLKLQKPKRSKRRSKFTKEQDMIIINMKKENKTWVEIAECAKVDSYLAARNRYQVLIGQQGGGTSECGPEDVMVLKEIVDDGEIEKMKYLSKEFRKCTGKLCSYKQVRELIRYLFWKNAGKFDVNSNYLHELKRLQQLRYEELGEEGKDEDNGGEAIENEKETDVLFHNDNDAIVKQEGEHNRAGAANSKTDFSFAKQA